METLGFDYPAQVAIVEHVISQHKTYINAIDPKCASKSWELSKFDLYCVPARDMTSRKSSPCWTEILRPHSHK
jgi:hypothetical protein